MHTRTNGHTRATDPAHHPATGAPVESVIPPLDPEPAPVPPDPAPPPAPSPLPQPVPEPPMPVDRRRWAGPPAGTGAFAQLVAG